MSSDVKLHNCLYVAPPCYCTKVSNGFLVPISWSKNRGSERTRTNATKINLFKQDAMRSGIGHGVAQASMSFAAVKNLCLYPIESLWGSKSYITPDQFINPQAASDMIRRAKGIARIIAPLI